MLCRQDGASSFTLLCFPRPLPLEFALPACLKCFNYLFIFKGCHPILHPPHPQFMFFHCCINLTLSSHLPQMSFDPGMLHNNGHSAYANGTGAGIRETGVVEKLLTSYGFIQCSERQARLFFHCSQYNGNLQELKIGGK